MTNLMVGSNYDPALPKALAELNLKYQKSNIRISEVYGSILGLTIFGTARPDFRVPEITRTDFEKSVQELNDHGILVNYTDNTPLVDKKDIDLEHVKSTLKYFEEIGIGRITVAHPLAMQLICKYTDIPIEVSTIYKANTQYQIRELARRYPNVNKICVDVAMNRDFKTLRLLKREADKHDIDLELLANEFCIKDCADRVQCYNEHAQCSTDKETSKFGRYPIGICTKLRNVIQPVEWTRASFILPQSMTHYAALTGINNIKVTGRTHPTAYILWVVETYMQKNFEGNLLELWADVKNISRISKGHSTFLDTKYHIDAAPYGNDFIEMYARGDMDDLDTEYETLERMLKTSMQYEK